ncbi:CDP-glucose 4,6-dehydratase [Sphingomonas yantingensis]|uniref:CDP-glucose 4,6-dehydratase n=1 Tax=Sphingomonas yantingensis TaxID=1241761 RepID=A0A7W9AT83_9SPHN|nr:CDP-glucose 4,6-dehydratase [Sphingomonas yantingensis]
MNPAHWQGRRVVVTGHTGFKGSWLVTMLRSFGAEVTGFALAPPTSPSMFDVLGIERDIEHVVGDIRDAAHLNAAMAAAAPDTVFHMAAQPLVRQSYVDPVETYATNVMGTVNVLEAVRATASVKQVVSVTTDKCYENREWPWPYREYEALGGFDPYSSSKACAEHVTSAYRNSFLRARGVQVASARAGNVIGGGDWANDRLVPDFFRAADKGEPVHCRFPGALRPWQHVLEPVSGYVTLAEALATRGEDAAEAWNFGPSEDDAMTVSWILDRLTGYYGGPGWARDGNEHPHEAGLLKLDSSKARQRLGWRPRWRLDRALEQTVAWHRAWRDGADMRRTTLDQIDQFIAARV